MARVLVSCPAQSLPTENDADVRITAPKNIDNQRV